MSAKVSQQCFGAAEAAPFPPRPELDYTISKSCSADRGAFHRTPRNPDALGLSSRRRMVSKIVAMTRSSPMLVLIIMW